MAYGFHWQPSELDDLEIDEIDAWLRELATIYRDEARAMRAARR